MKNLLPIFAANLASISLLILTNTAFAQPVPSITAQPQNQSAAVSSKATFTVLASGQSPLSYQWSFAGTNLTDNARISGAMDSTLAISDVVMGDAGNYQVIVSNKHGIAVSSNATLTVFLPLAISNIPDQKTFHSTPTRAIPFTISNTQTPALSSSSSDAMLVPTNNIIFGGAGSNRTVTLTPAAGLRGTTTITISVSDQGRTASNSFLVTVADFSDVTGNLPPAYLGQICWVDYDNDGALDLFTMGYGEDLLGHTRLFHNDGNGVFTEISTTLPNLGSTDFGNTLQPSAEWADFDNDGYADLLIKGSDGGRYFPQNSFCGIYRNHGNGEFTFVTNLFFTSKPVASGDYDNDGRVDVLVPNGNYSLLYRNVGDGSFTNFVAGLGGSAAVWGDYNSDGRADLFVGNTLLRNQGDGSFTNSGIQFPLLSNPRAVWGDYDNDGDPDLLLSGRTEDVVGLSRIYRNDNGALTNIGASLPAIRESAAAWGDFDNDGKLDFFLSGNDQANGNLSRIMRNLGGDSFADFGFTIPGIVGSVAWADYDNDGALDLSFIGYTNGIYNNTPTIRLYHNDGAMPNLPPTIPAGLSVVRGHNSALLSWIASTDNEQTGGLSYNVRIGTASGGVNVLSPLADLNTGFRRVPKPGNAGYRQSLLITNLSAGTYYWSVQAVDHVFKGSSFAPEQSFTLPAPVITNQPQSLTVLSGTTVEFQVGVTGAEPLFYQWKFNGTNISGATLSTLVFTNAQSNHTGNYFVVVSNAFGSAASSNVALVVNTPPQIIAQPQGVTKIEGSDAAFFVSATGDQPLSYQWMHNDVAIPGATNSSLHLSAIAPAQAGNYFVQITNLFGATNSAVVALDIPPSVPVILLQPQSQFAPAAMGVNAIFSVNAIGTTPLFYQWKFDNVDIPDATNASFIVTNVQVGGAGNYSVLITNAVGSTLSDDASLTTIPMAGSVTQTIPAASIADFVYDRQRDVLYFVTSSANIQRYHLGSSNFLSPISIAGLLGSLDLSLDGNTLAVGDLGFSGTNSWIHLVDLQSNTVRQVLFDKPATEAGIYSVAFGNDGSVLATAQFIGSASGGVRLRHYNPATDTTIVPTGVERNSPLTASGDGSTIAIANTSDSSGAVRTFDVASRAVDGFVWTGRYISDAPGVSHDGGQFAQSIGDGIMVYSNAHAFLFSSGLSYLTNIGQLGVSPLRLVYHPSEDLMFVGWGNTREIRAYETKTFSEVAVFDFGNALINSRTRMSRDGARFLELCRGESAGWIGRTFRPASPLNLQAELLLLELMLFSAREFSVRRG